MHRQAATLVPCGRGFHVLLTFLRMQFTQYQKNLLEARYAGFQDSSKFSSKPLPGLLHQTSELITGLELKGLSESGCSLDVQLPLPVGLTLALAPSLMSTHWFYQVGAAWFSGQPQ